MKNRVVFGLLLAVPIVPLSLDAQQCGRAPGEEPFSMEEIVVTGTASAARTKYQSSVAISTFDEQDIERQAPMSTADLLRAVPGFSVEGTSGTTKGNVFARGIIQDGGYRYVGLMEDGLPLYPVYELSLYNPDQLVRVDETIRRVETMRGGTAPILAAGAAGGTINFHHEGSKPDARDRHRANDRRLRALSPRRLLGRSGRERLGVRGRRLLPELGRHSRPGVRSR